MLPSRSNILAINTRFPPLRLHKKILNYLCLLILLINTKHKKKDDILDWRHLFISLKENSATR